MCIRFCALTWIQKKLDFNRFPSHQKPIFAYFSNEWSTFQFNKDVFFLILKIDENISENADLNSSGIKYQFCVCMRSQYCSHQISIFGCKKAATKWDRLCERVFKRLWSFFDQFSSSIEYDVWCLTLSLSLALALSVRLVTAREKVHAHFAPIWHAAMWTMCCAFVFLQFFFSSSFFLSIVLLMQYYTRVVWRKWKRKQEITKCTLQLSIK